MAFSDVITLTFISECYHDQPSEWMNLKNMLAGDPWDE